jgi:hypothetical protein
MAAIDTFKPGIRTGSFAPCRAGGFAGNHLIHSSFIPAKSASSRRMTVALTTRSRDVPAASRMAETFFRHCRVCSWIVSATIFPVTGSCGPVPETKTSPAARTAWLYAGGGDGAFVVRIISLAVHSSRARCKSHFGNFNTTVQPAMETETEVSVDLGLRVASWRIYALTGSRARGAISRQPRRPLA